MKTETVYLTQYFNLILEWQRNGINIDNASKSQLQLLQNLKTKALAQSGLSANELMLICLIRKRNIFTKVHVFARTLKGYINSKQ